LGIGGAFGELALLFNSERNATIKVDGGSELIVLHKDDFKKYMKF
jgi:CRP-like cAMP-binding protein